MDVLRRTLSSILDSTFSIERYAEIKTSCMLEDRRISRKPKSVKSAKIELGEDVASDVNEDLRQELQEWRTERYKADNVPAYTIIHQSTLLEIASRIPKTRESLLEIKGFGKAKYAKYGEEILAITSRY